MDLLSDHAQKWRDLDQSFFRKLFKIFWLFLKIFKNIFFCFEHPRDNFWRGRYKDLFFTPGKWWFKIKYTKIHSKHVFIRNLKSNPFAIEKHGFIRNDWLLRVDLVIVTPAHTCVVSTIFPEKYCVTVRRPWWKPDWIQCQKHHFFGRLRRKKMWNILESEGECKGGTL